jgi:hypothetical protein
MGQSTQLQPWSPIPENWQPYYQRVDAATAARMDGMSHPVSNPVNPGFAYGTLIPADSPSVGSRMWTQPYLYPVARTYTLQVPDRAQVQGMTPNPGPSVNVSGYAPASMFSPEDVSAESAIESYLNTLRRT